MDQDEQQLLMRATMAGATMAMRETEKIRAVFTRFLNLRSTCDEEERTRAAEGDERELPTAQEHARQAMMEVNALVKELEAEGLPLPLGAGPVPVPDGTAP